MLLNAVNGWAQNDGDTVASGALVWTLASCCHLVPVENRLYTIPFYIILSDFLRLTVNTKWRNEFEMDSKRWNRKGKWKNDKGKNKNKKGEKFCLKKSPATSHNEGQCVILV